MRKVRRNGNEELEEGNELEATGNKWELRKRKGRRCRPKDSSRQREITD